LTIIDFKGYIRNGDGRADISSLFLDPAAFDLAVKGMSEPFRSSKVSKVVALDALGFVFGPGIARELGVGLALFRKEGKVPVEKKTVHFVDYTKTSKAFEVASAAMAPGDRILLVDEWSETGSQIKAAISLVQQCGGLVVGVSCFNMDFSVRMDRELSGYHVHSLLWDGGD
jgi:adenine phosphoribosyltransferase